MEGEEKENSNNGSGGEPETRVKEKSEKTWWRRTGSADVHVSPDLPTPTTPTSPTLQETKRFEFVLPSQIKLLTLNDVFKTPQTIATWNNNATKKTVKTAIEIRLQFHGTKLSSPNEINPHTLT